MIQPLNKNRLKNLISGDLIKGTGLVSIGNGINFLLGGIYWFILAYLMSPNNYGRINFYFSLATYTAAITLFGLNYTLINEYSQMKNKNIIFETYLLVILFSFIGSIILFILFYKKIIWIDLILIIAFLFCITISTILMSTWIAKKQYKMFVFFILLLRFLRIILSLILYLFFDSIESILLGFILGTFPLLVIFIRYILQYKTFPLTIPKINKGNINMFIYSILNSGIIYLDKIIIWLLYGDQTLGIYQFAFQFFMILNIFPISFFNVALSNDNKKLEKNKEDNEKQVKIITIITIIITIFTLLLTWTLIPFIFPVYSNARKMLIALVLGIPLSMISSWEASKHIKKYKYKKVILINLSSIFVEIIGIIILPLIFSIYSLGLIIPLAYLIQVTLYLF